jgi:molybdopterin/thiamine biosynthesis adenylyltransferase
MTKSWDDTNRNRFIGARHDDPVPGSAKVDLAARLIREINPGVAAVPLKTNLVTAEAFEAVKSADWIFGCFDEDGPRAILNEVCASYAKPYIDLASDVPESGIYGGRVCVCLDGNGCLSCLGQLDDKDVRRYLSTEKERAAEAAVYGIPVAALGHAGPSVSPINGVVAALAATEFMVAVTGMRPPNRLLTYHGHLSQVRISADQPQPDCYYCKGIRGTPAAADVERYLKMTHLRERGGTASPKG